MKLHPHHQLAARWFEEVWNQRKTDTVYELLAPGAVGHLEGRQVIGPDEFILVRDELLRLLPDLRMTIDEILADDTRAVVRWTVQGAGLNQTIPAQISFSGMTWFHFGAGQIIEGWDAWNQGGLAQQFQAG